MEASALGARQLLLIAAGIALLAGLVALLIARAAARGSGFRPTLRGGATVVASDTGAGASVLLSDPALGLRGRPDYLLEEDAGVDRFLVPLEIKPTRRSQRLYESDDVQLGAYVIAHALHSDHGQPTSVTSAIPNGCSSSNSRTNCNDASTISSLRFGVAARSTRSVGRIAWALGVPAAPCGRTATKPCGRRATLQVAGRDLGSPVGLSTSSASARTFDLRTLEGANGGGRGSGDTRGAV